MALINHRHRFIFLFEPHTASRAISENFGNTSGCELVGSHHCPLNVVKRSNSRCRLYNVVVTARNPFDTLVTRWARRDIKTYPDLNEFIKSPAYTGQIVSVGEGMWLDSDTTVWYEHLNSDVKKLFGSPLPERNPDHISPLKTKPWYEYFNKESFDFLLLRYGAYSEKFGYEFKWSGGRIHCSINQSFRAKESTFVRPV